MLSVDDRFGFPVPPAMHGPLALWVLFASDSRYYTTSHHTKYDIISWTSLFFEICSILNFNYITVYFRGENNLIASVNRC
jgi:hypothetical protein